MNKISNIGKQNNSTQTKLQKKSVRQTWLTNHFTQLKLKVHVYFRSTIKEKGQIVKTKRKIHPLLFYGLRKKKKKRCPVGVKSEIVKESK